MTSDAGPCREEPFGGRLASSRKIVTGVDGSRRVELWAASGGSAEALDWGRH